MTKVNLGKARRFLSRLDPPKLAKAKRYREETCKNEMENLDVVFPVGFVLHAFGCIPDSDRTKTEQQWLKKCLQYLISQDAGSYSFNYWTRESEIYKKSPLPDDIDDTVCALAGMLQLGEDIHEKYFIKMIQIEQKPGGPYNTWYVDLSTDNNGIWTDIDPIVNANALYFAALYGIELPNTEKYVLKCLRESKVSSPYYPYNLMFLYNIAKYVHESRSEKARKLVSKKLEEIRNFNDLSPLEKLLYGLSSVYLGHGIKKSQLDKICSLQKTDGSLPPLPVCTDFAQNKKTTYCGTSPAATALFLELLAKIHYADYDDHDEGDPSAVQSRSYPKEITAAVARQKKAIERELSQIPFKSQINQSVPEREIYKPLVAPISLALDLEKKLSKKDVQLIDNLSVAAFFLWEGYTIFDGIIDEQVTTELIPIASTLIRLGWKYCNHIIQKKPEYERIIMDALLVCDKNYVWEVQNTKFDNQNFLKLASKRWTTDYIVRRMEPYLKSLAFIPMLLDLGDSKCRFLYAFLRSLMLIDQLNDDAHDWKEDNAAGTMTYVLAQLYKKEPDPEKHEETFWKDVMPMIIDVCKKEYEKAQAALQRIEPSGDHLQLLLDLKFKPIIRAEKERRKVMRILKNIDNN